MITCPAPVSILSPLAIPITVVYTAPTVALGTPPWGGPLCAPASGTIFSPGTTTVNCTVTDSKQRSASCSFGVTVTLPPRLAVTRFLAFGDSITWGEDGSNGPNRLAGTLGTIRPHVQLPTPDTYPGALQSDLASRYTAQTPTVDNKGKPGEAATDPATFVRFATLTSSGAYDAVLLMEGANDLGSHSYPAITGALGQMVDQAKSRGLRVLLATIPPENASGCCPYDRGVEAGLVEGLDEQIRTLSASKQVPLVDVYQAFGGDLSLIGPDGLHPTAAGYHRIADTFFMVIRATLETTATTTARPTPSRSRFLALPRRP